MLINLINDYTYKCDNLTKTGKELKNIFAPTIQFLGAMTPLSLPQIKPKTTTRTQLHSIAYFYILCNNTILYRSILLWTHYTHDTQTFHFFSNIFSILTMILFHRFNLL